MIFNLNKVADGNEDLIYNSINWQSFGSFKHHMFSFF